MGAELVSDTYGIDSHKLMFHPREVARWLDGEDIYPVYVEISPSGACNHRCLFCALDYLGYEPRFLETVMLRDRVAEMGRLGVKSIMFGGEGEPLLHPDIGEIIKHTKASGIDVAVTTNGVLLTRETAGLIVSEASWIKVSLDAGTASTYAAVHGTRKEDFDRVFANIEAAADEIARRGADCVLGVQALLLPENAGEMELLAKRSREAGAAYLVVKSYSQHQRSLTRRYADPDYGSPDKLAETLQKYSNERFRVVVRLNAMRKLQQPRGYERCLALPFWAYIDAGGTVWGCSAFLGDERFRYGSICQETFEQLWHSEARQRALSYVAQRLAAEDCRRNCRMDEVNRYLWELTHPRGHVNFI